VIVTCIGSYVNKQVTTFTFRAQATTCSKHHTRTVMDARCECAPWVRSAHPSDSWALVNTIDQRRTLACSTQHMSLLSGRPCLRFSYLFISILFFLDLVLWSSCRLEIFLLAGLITCRRLMAPVRHDFKEAPNENLPIVPALIRDSVAAAERCEQHAQLSFIFITRAALSE